MKTIQYAEKKIKVEIEEISNGVFYIRYYFGDYCFDEYLIKGICNIDEHCDFIYKNLVNNEAGLKADDYA